MVRIWRLPPRLLFHRFHLLGLHNEIGIAVNALIKLEQGIKAGWQSHPQVLRFQHHLGQLYNLHDQVVKEMKRRGYHHQSPLPDYFHLRERYTYSWIGALRDFSIVLFRECKFVLRGWMKRITRIVKPQTLNMSSVSV